MTEEEIQLYVDYKELFGSERGKRVLENLTKVFNFGKSIVPRDNNGRIDIFEVMRNEGKRAVIVHILHKVNAVFEEGKQQQAIHEPKL